MSMRLIRQIETGDGVKLKIILDDDKVILTAGMVEENDHRSAEFRFSIHEAELIGEGLLGSVSFQPAKDGVN